jgi:hypothetical protein
MAPAQLAGEVGVVVRAVEVQITVLRCVVDAAGDQVGRRKPAVGEPLLVAERVRGLLAARGGIRWTGRLVGAVAGQPGRVGDPRPEPDGHLVSDLAARLEVADLNLVEDATD